MSLKVIFKDKSKIVKRKLKIARDRSLRAGGPIGVNTMQSLVPVDTWSLHDSIRIELELELNQIVWKAGGTNQSASQINDPVVYAQVVEFGRSDLPAYPVQPYFVPGLVEAVKEIRSAAIQELRSVLK